MPIGTYASPSGQVGGGQAQLPSQQQRRAFPVGPLRMCRASTGGVVHHAPGTVQPVYPSDASGSRWRRRVLSDSSSAHRCAAGVRQPPVERRSSVRAVGRWPFQPPTTSGLAAAG